MGCEAYRMDQNVGTIGTSCIGAYLFALLDPASNEFWCEGILKLGLLAPLHVLVCPFGTRVDNANAGSEESILLLLVGDLHGWRW